jgi:hypothetical protein
VSDLQWLTSLWMSWRAVRGMPQPDHQGPDCLPGWSAAGAGRRRSYRTQWLVLRWFPGERPGDRTAARRVRLGALGVTGKIPENFLKLSQVS